MSKSAVLAWLVIAAPIAALFGAALATDCSFAMRDSAHFYYPLFEWCCREWAAARVPLWNPLENGGVPVVGDATSSVFYPGKLLFVLPLDFALRYKLYIVSHVVLAAMNSYVLARAWHASQLAAAIAAVSYSCGGNVVFQYSNVVFLVGAAWLPLAALAIDRMLSLVSWRWAVGLGVILALMVLGGDPQAAYHVVLMGGLYAILLTAGKHAARPWLSTLSSRGALLLLASFVGLTLSAVQVMPSLEAAALSDRVAHDRPRNLYEAVASALHSTKDNLPAAERTTHEEQIYEFSVGPWRLAEYFWPNVTGRMFPTHRRWLTAVPAEGRIWTPTLYLGLLPVILALSCFSLRTANVRQRWLTWLTLLVTLASFGGYGAVWLAKEIYFDVFGGDPTKIHVADPVGGLYWLFVLCLPGYVTFRYPAKLLTIAALGLTQLAARGWDRAWGEQRPRLAGVLLVLGTSSGIAALFLARMGGQIFPKKLPADATFGPFDKAGAHFDIVFALAQTAVVALAAHWLLQQAWQYPRNSRRCQLVMTVVTVIELVVANAWLIATAPASIWRREPYLAQALRRPALSAEPVPTRVYRGSLVSWQSGPFRFRSDKNRMAELAAWESRNLLPKHHLHVGLSLVESFSSLRLQDYESFLAVARRHGPQQRDGMFLPQPTALRLLATDSLLLPHREKPSYSDSEPIDPSAVAWRMNWTYPHSWIVHSVETLPELRQPRSVAAIEARTEEVLFPGMRARDFRRVAVVETDQPLPEWRNHGTQSFDPHASPDESCRVTAYDPQRVVVEATLDRAGLVVLSEAWYPGWRAVVSSGDQSRDVPIYRTNRVLRGVWLPAGHHTIEFIYRPQSFIAGAAISVIAWVALLGLVCIRWLRR